MELDIRKDSTHRSPSLIREEERKRNEGKLPFTKKKGGVFITYKRYRTLTLTLTLENYIQSKVTRALKRRKKKENKSRSSVSISHLNMMPSGPPTPVGGGAQLPLLRSSSGLLGGGAQPNPVNSQQPFSSFVSPRTQFNASNNNNSMSILGNISNVSSLINQSMSNGAGLQHLGSGEPDPLSFASSGVPGDHSQPQQQFSVPQQQQQIRGGLSAVKLEAQMGSLDQNGPNSQQLQTLRSIGGVKMEPQQLQTIRSLGTVKMEPHNDSSILLQQQQQHLLQMSRQSQLNLLQQQRVMQLQQQQQLLRGLPPRAQLQQQQLQQNLPLRAQLKTSNYEPGLCARRLTQYMYHQQRRPEDNNIEFWRKFVGEFFAPNAKKRWCVSLYGSGRQTTGVFPQDVWHCEICNRKPGRGFETTAEVLPRLCQIKYASGTLEELLYVDMPRESHNIMGQIVLDYPKAIQESVFEQLRVVRDGHLRIVFNLDLKISSWEFCARKHEELIPRRLIIPQVSQLGAVVQKYQNAVQNASSGLSTQDLQNSCNSFVASTRQLAKALEVPLVNDLGYTKRYVRCLQISEVVNSMKDLIDYSRETGTGPMDSLINFPRRNFSSGINPQQQSQQPEAQHQTIAQNNHNNNHSTANATIMHPSSCINGAPSVNNSVSGPSSTTISGLLQHQNSMNSRQDNHLGTVSRPYGGNNSSQIPSTSSTSSLPEPQPNTASPFSPPTPSTSNNNTTQNTANMSSMQQQQQQAQTNEPDPSDSQSSVQHILQEMMMCSSPMNGATTSGNEMKGMNGISPMNSFGMGYGNIGGVGPSATVSGLRAATVNNAMGMNGRVGMNHTTHNNVLGMNHQQQNMGNRLIGGLGSVNNFDNFQFDWKSSG
ncbi:uncharacterized protein A4U43_C04F29120 [Asparagus officinalis]|uniref:Transcriptional corepressor SEUSS n=1 Tax=Asparagus officinalis TaxID=4686 RepID=A0A5P1F685_ASPOF|nr:transcriptional corepressor SEUSS-like [Asparagus officinalis]ONK73263.1 uncharacterized protein A4U43_C04F29120 [Asparagus officinalis]